MFFSKFYLSAPLFALFLVCGCSSTESVKVPVKAAKESPQLEQRADALKKKISHFAVRGIVLDTNSIRYRNMEQTVERLRKMGFNRVLFGLQEGDLAYGSDATEFFGLCRRAGIDVYGLLRQTDAVYKPSNNLFMRKFFDEKVTLAGVTAGFAKQNRFLSEEKRLKGFVLSMTPHLFNSSDPARPSGCPYSWGDSRFGTGLDNESLICFSIREVEEAVRAAAPLPVMVQIPDSYYGFVNAGKLPKGLLDRFALSGEKKRELILLNSGNKPSELFKRVESGLKEVPGEIPLLTAVNLAPHTAVVKGELRRRDWNDMVRSISYAVTKYRGHRKMTGLILGPFDRLELLLEEK